MFYFLLWIGLAVAVGMVATQRNRGSGNWFMVALVFSPVIAIIFLLAMPSLKPADTAALDQVERVKCPACAELVLPDASVCKHCGGALVPDTGAAMRAAAAREVAAIDARDSRNIKVGVALVCLVFVVYACVSRS